ncbi:MAG TPA: hypothetical protein VF007_04100 [Stellaceae bacterium]
MKRRVPRLRSDEEAEAFVESDLSDLDFSQFKSGRLRFEGPPASETYRLFERAMIERKQIVCTYKGHRREICPIVLGHTQGEERALTYQFAGGSSSTLPPEGEWRCLTLSSVSDAQLREGAWHKGDSHKQPSGCIEVVDLDANPESPYKPKRRLADIASDQPIRRRKKTTVRTSGRKKARPAAE